MHTRTKTTLVSTLLLTGALAFGCDKTPAETTPPETAGPTEPAGPAQTEEPAGEPAQDQAPAGWADMDRAQRKRFMGVEVMPAMKKLFQEHDAKAFAGFKCQTCHGDDWTNEGVDFKMPNALYPLPEDDPIKAAREYDAEMTAFMVEKVMPAMGDLLGKPYDKETGKGEFGCHSCHLKE
ncbi:MAG: hypothetical protein R3A51_05445 [Nannocystaceae bacterium]|nr:hypothetical protein [Myxococcales bacterium]